MTEASVAMTHHTGSSSRHEHHRLDQLRAGTRAVVQQIESEDHAMQQLKAMGLCVGRHIEVIRHGNPLIVKLLGSRVGISGRVARHIVVEVNG